MSKKALVILFISLCLILSGCKKDFYNYPEHYSSFLDKSLGKWQITDVKDTNQQSGEHTEKVRTWLITGENGTTLTLHDSMSAFSSTLTNETADIIFTKQILNNIDNRYRKEISSQIKNLNEDMLDASYFYTNELNNDDKYLKKKDNSYAKEILNNLSLKDINPKKFYAEWGTKIQVSIDVADNNFDKNESIRKEVCSFLNKKYNMNNIKVIVYAEKSRQYHTSSYIDNQYFDIN